MDIKQDASHERKEYELQKVRWETINALLEKEQNLKDLRYAEISKYLLKMPGESDEIHSDRIKRINYWPAVPETLQGMVGILTAKGHSIDTIKDEELKNQVSYPLKGDLSLATLIDQFTTAVCEFGIAYMLISPGSNVQATAKGDLEADRKVKWTIYTPVSVINWSYSDAGLTGDPRHADYLVLKQFKEVKDGDFGHEVIEEYLKISKEGTIVYHDKGGEAGPERVSELIPHTDINGNPLGFIPMVAAYYKKSLKPFVTTPPLNSIAQLSLNHLNIQSNHDLAVRHSQFPIPVFKNVTAEQRKKMSDLKIGPSLALLLPEGVEFQMVETTGRSLQQGAESLKSTEEKINQLSYRELMADPNISRDVSAEETKVKYQNKVSPLAAAGLNIQQAINDAIQVHAAYLGKKVTEAEQFKLSFDIARISLSSDEIRALIELTQNRIITREMVYEKVSNGLLLDNKIPFNKIKSQLEDEALDI